MPALRLTPPADWPTLGWVAIDWIETHLCHGPGDVEGEPIVLDDEVCQFLLDVYRLFPAGHAQEGRRVVFDATFSRPKGRAKSETAGMLVCFEFVGPCRFSHWDEAGEPVGKPVKSPMIRCLATEEGQAGNTYDNVYTMLRHLKEKFPKEYGYLDVKATRVLKGTEAAGKIQPSTSGSASKDGGKETFAVADETHLYVLPELKAMIKTVRRNLRKRAKLAEPWFLATTTMYKPGQDSTAEGRHEAARKAKGKKTRDLSILFDHREGFPVSDDDWDNDEIMLRSLEEAYGVASEWLDLTGFLSEIRDPDNDRGDSERYFLNRRSATADSAFDADEWDDCKGDFEVERGELVVLGFDGARFRDSTALVGCIVETGQLFLVDIWERPENAHEDWQTPEADVTAAVEYAMDRWDVWRMYCDPFYWESTINAWANTYGDDRVIEWHTNRQKQAAYACRAFGTAIRTGALEHSDDPDLSRHIKNSYRRDAPRMKDDDGKALWTICKERPDSPRKIDAAMAAILAWEARGDALAKGVRKKRARLLAAF